MAPGSSVIYYQGFLLKEYSGLQPSRRKRWCILSGTTLRCFKQPDDGLDVGQYNISNCVVGESNTNGCEIHLKSNTFLAREPKVVFVAPNAEEREKWVTEMRKASKLAPQAQFVRSLGVESITATFSDAVHIYSHADQKKKKYGLEDFEVVKLLGKGNWGHVSKVKLKGTNQYYAMKQLKKDDIEKGEMVQQVIEEKNVLSLLHHPFIVKIHFAFQTHSGLYLILDLLSGGELFDLIQSCDHFSEPRSRLYGAEIASALMHLHAKDIIYRDLKPENIVLDKDGHAVVTDFGLARSKKSKFSKSYTFCGTPEYLAPEIVSGVGHDFSVDWWTFGVLMYEMIVGEAPFSKEEGQDEGVLFEQIENKALTFPDYVSPEARDLISGLLNRDPRERYKDEDVLAHPFFHEIDWDKLLRREYEPEYKPPQE